MANQSNNQANSRGTGNGRTSARGATKKRLMVQATPQVAPTSSRTVGRIAEDGGSLIIGVGVGIALYYLLGDGGKKRRVTLTRSAGGLFASAANAVQSHTGNTGRHFADGLHDGTAVAKKILRSALSAAVAGKSQIASAARSSAGNLVEGARDRSTELQNYLRQRAAAVTRDARESKNDLVNRASLALGRERDHYYVGQTACAVGSVALGAGAFWLLDPRLGRSRRAWLASKGTHLLNDAGRFFRQSGRYIGSRVSNRVTQAKAQYRNEPASDSKLQNRIRAELGHISADNSKVSVDVRDGWVSLGGIAPQSDVQSIANFVLGIRGVRGLDNGIRSQIGVATAS